ncbi:MAG: TOBE domain-containing protein, partial [Micrococcales bacterium]|nr:TOBE domain-containing protein [Micrococcales bacterium]
ARRFPRRAHPAYRGSSTPSDRRICIVRLSTRNQLTGTITDIALGSVMASVKVELDGGGQVVTASITKEAVKELQLEVGSAATVLVKSTEVMIGVE